jgi:sulfur-carrier protein
MDVMQPGDRRLATAVRVVLPQHLRTLARVGGEVSVSVPGVPTIGAVLEAIERQYPVLQGTIRDHGTLKRRPFIRFYACEEDFSHDPPDTPLPEKIRTGDEPFLVIGAIAGG